MARQDIGKFQALQLKYEENTEVKYIIENNIGMNNLQYLKDGNEILQFIINNGMIDISDVQDSMETMKREELLKKHPYKIWQGKDGKWYTYLPDESKKDGRRLVKRGEKKSLEDIVSGYWKRFGEIHTLKSTFYEWADEKLRYGEIEKNTYDRYETDFHRFFNDGFEDTNIKNITEDELEDFIKSTINRKKLTSKAYSGMRTLIIGIFKYAKKYKYSDISIHTFFGDLNLSKKIFVKKVKCAEKEVFTEDEIKSIVKYINGKELKIRELGILLAIYTGMRPGELSALKPSDIKKNDRTIHVQRSEVKFKDGNGKTVIGVKDFPKSEAGDRYLLLNDKAYDTMKRILRMNPFGEYLFQDEKTRKRITENGFNHKLNRICTAVNIPVRTMHKLRKTYGTTLIDHGVDDSIIKEQMGHADIKTTRQYYYYSNQSNGEKLEQLNRACIM